MYKVDRVASMLIATALTFGLFVQAAAVTITVDGKTEHQVMEGIGGYGSIYPSHQKSADPVYTQQFINMLINDMGASMIRIQVPPAFEVTNDNNDPSNTNLSNFNIDQIGSDGCKYRIRTIAQEVPYWKALRQAAQANGEDIRIIATMWSPPWWMKISNCVYGMVRSTCQLKSSARDELAEYCEAFVRIFKRETGFDLYAFSFQNEPDFVEPYQSCVYEGDTYVAAFEVIANRFAQKGLSMRFFGPEDMAVRVNMNYGPEFMGSQAIQDHLHAYAVHGYSDGVAPTPNSQAATVWRQVGGFANATLGVPAWMTETSGQGKDWNGAMTKALAMGIAFYYGNVAVWTRWTWHDEVIQNGTTRKPQFAAYKHYAKWIRPGAVRIGTQFDGSDVLAVAFNHKQNKTLTVVIVNSGSSSTSCTITGDNLPSSYQAFQSKGAGEYAPSIGTVQPGNISLPANSITTLYATGYEEDGQVAVNQTHDLRRTLPTTAAGALTAYGLDGRQIRGTAGAATGRHAVRQRCRGIAVCRTGDGRTFKTAAGVLAR
ncbi:MAG: hypothetical protein GF331_04135 [Chitinivibrionales bacterium]|nr:hypothetical protein [Chitinivibrionales bacterium]